MKVMIFLIGIVTGFLFSQTPVPVASHPLIVPGLDATFKTSDGWTINGKYMPAQKGKKTFLLLHGRGESKEHWLVLSRSLQRAGFGYLAIDLRGHGESLLGPQGTTSWKKFRVTRSQNDFWTMRFDIMGAIQYLAGQGVTEDSIGLIGDEVGGSLALKYAAVHPQIPMVILISPGLNYEEVLTVNAVRAYKNRPILMIYSESDRKSSHEAPLLYEFAKISAGDRNASLISLPNENGRRIASYRPLAKQIVSWIENPIKPEPPVVSTSTSTISTSTISSETTGTPPLLPPTP